MGDDKANDNGTMMVVPSVGRAGLFDRLRLTDKNLESRSGRIGRWPTIMSATPATCKPIL